MKLTKYIAIGLLAITGSSCSGILDQMPKSDLHTGIFFTNDAEVNSGVIGCYNQLQQMYNVEFALTELRSDNTRSQSINSSSEINKELMQANENEFPTSHSFVTKYWEASYTEIYRCNLVLQSIDVVENPTKKAQYEGEALFLRSLTYFNLVRLWGGVFVVETPITAPEARYAKRSTLDQSYALIERDLEKIVDNSLLPASQAKNDLGRVDLIAAKALLAKVYMTHYPISNTAKWDRAKTLLEQVLATKGISDDGGTLTAIDRVFSIDNEMNDELLFTVRYRQGGLGLGSPFGNLFAPVNSGTDVIVGSGSGQNYPSTNFFDLMPSKWPLTAAPSTDKRGDIYYANGYKTVLYRHIKKFTSPVTIALDGESDWPVLRMGDVILLYAELLLDYSNDAAKATKYVNKTRQRAGLSALSTVTQEDVRTERRKELAFENHRWFDLMRWGIAIETAQDFLRNEKTDDDPTKYFLTNTSVQPTNTLSSWQALLPIPLKVMNVNPAIEQNPGYAGKVD